MCDRGILCFRFFPNTKNTPSPTVRGPLVIITESSSSVSPCYPTLFTLFALLARVFGASRLCRPMSTSLASNKGLGFCHVLVAILSSKTGVFHVCQTLAMSRSINFRLDQAQLDITTLDGASEFT